MQEQKQHSACDQCRRRKLKCPGERPSCSRCQDEQVACNYSPRKVMGRPRKRIREDTDNQDELSESNNDYQGYEPEHNADIAALEDMVIPNFDDWVLPPATDAVGHDEDVQNLMQQDTNVFAQKPSVSGNFLNPEWPVQGQDYLPSPHSLDDGGPSLNGDIVEDSVSIGQFYAARYEGSGHPSEEPCACLSSMYLAASSIERSRTAGFPVALTPLKAALQTTKVILLCKKCPTERASGSQNVMILHALLSSIALGFDKLLKSINNEIKRASEAGEMKTLDVGDRSVDNAHFHTGEADCPARFSMELEPEEWGMLTKRLIKNCIWGNKTGSLTLERLVEATESRQRAWHSVDVPSMPHHHHSDFTCLRLTAEVRRHMASMPQ